MYSCLTIVAAAKAARRTVRGLACLAVHVRYWAPETTAADLQAMFEQAGKVWDIQMIKSVKTGRPLGRALVRFYEGTYQPAATPDALPDLPPPSEDEIEAVTKTVDIAIGRFDRTTLHGSPIFVRRTSSGPSQLHQWYRQHDADFVDGPGDQLRANIFPVNPFHNQSRPTDDYHQGFMAGFKLGLKDGSSNPKT
ncbi:hypothetical protein LPJ70_000463 [Coemansia sp. RSA 2708]|nr:hypothetical protein LPJ70_000463 [Coemansia sp. RSA 2708]KAJ2356362.1 hypothetical protein H4S01_006716 [Coemansia sp. RSA 2610]